MADSTFDLHMHTTASDGTDSPDELILKAASCGIEVLAINDHDTTAGCDGLSRRYEQFLIADAPYRAYRIPTAAGEVTFIPGAEISTRSDVARHHILALGYDLDHPAMEELIAENLVRRRKSLLFKIEVAESRGAKLDDEEKERLFKIPNAGRPHLAQMFVEKGLAKDVPDAFSKYLSNMPPNSEKMYASPEHAISQIHKAHGIAIWAHPIGGEGEKRLSEDEFARACSIMAAADIDGCECFYSRYDADEIQMLCAIANQQRWLRSGGSDYHGTNKTVELGALHSGSPKNNEDQSLHITIKDVDVIQRLLGIVHMDFM